MEGHKGWLLLLLGIISLWWGMCWASRPRGASPAAPLLPFLSSPHPHSSRAAAWSWPGAWAALGRVGLAPSSSRACGTAGQASPGCDAPEGKQEGVHGADLWEQSAELEPVEETQAPDSATLLRPTARPSPRT